MLDLDTSLVLYPRIAFNGSAQQIEQSIVLQLAIQLLINLIITRFDH